jgi:hypothetical protein
MIFWVTVNKQVLQQTDGRFSGDSAIETLNTNLDNPDGRPGLTLPANDPLYPDLEHGPMIVQSIVGGAGGELPNLKRSLSDPTVACATTNASRGCYYRVEMRTRRLQVRSDISLHLSKVSYRQKERGP